MAKRSWPGVRRMLEDAALLAHLAIDDDHVYATAPHGGARLLAIRHDGSGRRALVPAKARALTRVVAAGDELYATSGRELVRITKTTGTCTTLATGPASFWGLAVDGAHVYASMLGSGPAHAEGGVVRVPRDGGALAWVVQGRPVSALAARDGAVAFASQGELVLCDAHARALAPARNPHAIAFVGDTLVWTEFDAAGALAAVDRRGGARRELAGAGYTSGLAIVGDWIYWSQSARAKTGTSLWRVQLGGSPQPLARFASKAAPVAATAGLIGWIDDCAGGVGAIDPRTLA